MGENKIIVLRARKVLSDPAASAWYRGMKDLLVEQGLHEKESQALFDEKEFARRYGVSWPRRDREALLDFQREAHLSDRQIRLLNRSSSLKWRDGRIDVHGPFWIALGGYYIIATLWLVLGTLLVAGAHRDEYGLRAMAILSVGVLVIGLMSRYMWLHSVFPRKVRNAVACARSPSEAKRELLLFELRRVDAIEDPIGENSVRPERQDQA